MWNFGGWVEDTKGAESVNDLRLRKLNPVQ